MNENSSDRLTGIGGWLLFLCCWFVVLAPAYNIGLTYFLQRRLAEVNPADAEMMREGGMSGILWSIVLLRSALLFVGGMALILKREAWAVWFALAILWLAGPLLIVAPALMADWEYSSPGLARSVLSAACWSLYLWFSKRVRNTYNFRPEA